MGSGVTHAGETELWSLELVVTCRREKKWWEIIKGFYMEVVEKEKSEITEKRKGRTADTRGDDAGKWSKSRK